MNTWIAFDAYVGVTALAALAAIVASSGVGMKKLNIVLVGLGGIGVAFACWIAWATWGIKFVYEYWTGSKAIDGAIGDDLQRLGQIGDLFGGVNALFAAFAFVGVAIAAYYQHKTFKLQSEQNVRQAFEPLFFKLLEGHEPPVSLRSDWYADEAFATDRHLGPCIAEGREQLRNARTMAKHARPEERTVWSDYSEIYESLYAANESALGPYFRQLYHVFKLIARSDLSWEDKVQYANIARAALSSDEVLLLLLNCASPRGRDFKPYVDGFGLLKHVSRDTPDGRPTIDVTLALDLYPRTAVMDAKSREEYWGKHPNERPDWAVNGRAGYSLLH